MKIDNIKYFIMIFLLLILILIPFSNCYADSFYLPFINYSIPSHSFFEVHYPQVYDFYVNSLLKNPIPVFLYSWFIGYEKEFSEKSLFNHLFEFELSTSFPFILGQENGKSDTVWLFYLKYGIGLKKISIENFIFLKISLFSGICYGYHYITSKPLVVEDEQYYLKTFHYFEFYIEPKFSYGFKITNDFFIFLSYSRKIPIFYSKSFNPPDYLQFTLYFEYII